MPADLRNLSLEQLATLADELRAETVQSVSRTGGHLGAGLGVIELTVALHHVFETPSDRLIWDVGHQAYPHKILTGRRDRIRTLRQEGGLSGFTRRAESEYDPFGDGSMSAGMAFEALNNAGALDARLIVILNDNDMSIPPPTGAMSAYLARLASGKAYLGLRDFGKKLTSYLGERADRAIKRAVE